MSASSVLLGTRQIRRLSVAAVFCGVLLAQSFDVASVELAAPNSTFGNVYTGGPGTSVPSQFTGTNVTLSGLVRRAFGTTRRDEVNVPEWANTVRLDVTATVPPGTTTEQFNLMLQNLLAARFHMTYHKISQEFPSYNLTVANGGPKLTPADGGPGGPSTSVRASCSGDHVILHSRDLPGVADAIAAASGVRVIDQTGLSGRYNLDLYVGIDHSGDGRMHCNGQLPSAPGVVEAVEQQLGLKLETINVTVDVVVVDQLDNVPTSN